MMSKKVPFNQQDRLVIMGTIASPFGVQGWVKIKTNIQSLESLAKYKKVYVLINNVWVIKSIVKHEIYNNIFHTKLDGVNDRDSATLLRGCEIAVSRDDFPNIENDEYYLVDLMGLSVYNKQHNYLGIVTDFIETGANTVLVILGDSDREKRDAVEDKKVQRLIPFVAQYICDVNLSNKQIIVDWGLDY